MAIRVQPAGPLQQIGQGARLPLDPLRGTVGIAAAAGNDLISMMKRAEAADREREKYDIANRTSEAITETQTRLLEITDPAEYRKVATEEFARISDEASKAATDDDMRREVNNIIGARLRAAKLGAAGTAVRMSADSAWESFGLSLQEGERLETRGIAGQYFKGLRTEVEKLADEAMRPVPEVMQEINSAEGANSNLRYARDLALYKEGNFPAWEKTVKSEKLWDEQYPYANPNLRAQALNQIETYKSKLFSRTTAAFRLAVDSAVTQQAINPVAEIDIGPMEQTFAAAASLATDQSDAAQLAVMGRTLAKFRAHNNARVDFLTGGGAAPLADEVFKNATRVAELSEAERIETAAAQDFLSAFGASERKNGRKYTAAQLLGRDLGTGDFLGYAATDSAIPRWNDPDINAWTRNASEVIGAPVPSMDKTEYAAFKTILTTAPPDAVAEAIAITRTYDSDSRMALIQELANDPPKNFDEQVMYALVAFDMQPDVVRQVVQGAREQSFPKIENVRAYTQLSDRLEAFFAGTNFDLREATSAVAATKALAGARGFLPDELETDDQFSHLFDEIVGYDPDLGTGGLTTLGGRYARVPPKVEAEVFEDKLFAVPLTDLEAFANGPIYQQPDLEAMKTGGDLIRAGIHPVSVGGGWYRMMQGDRSLRVAPGGRDWEVNLDAFAETWEPPVRERDTAPIERQVPELPDRAPLPIGSSFRNR